MFSLFFPSFQYVYFFIHLLLAYRHLNFEKKKKKEFQVCPIYVIGIWSSWSMNCDVVLPIFIFCVEHDESYSLQISEHLKVIKHYSMTDFLEESTVDRLL